MKKELQMAENALCEREFEKAMEEFDDRHSYWVQLRSCKADVCRTEHYIVLRSYRTFVAVINNETGHGYDLLRMVYGYTATTAQHINKFYKDYGGYYHHTWRAV